MRNHTVKNHTGGVRTGSGFVQNRMSSPVGAAPAHPNAPRVLEARRATHGRKSTPPPAQPDTISPPADASAPPPKEPLLKRLVSVEAVIPTLTAAIVQQLHDWPVKWAGGGTVLRSAPTVRSYGDTAARDTAVMVWSCLLW